MTTPRVLEMVVQLLEDTTEAERNEFARRMAWQCGTAAEAALRIHQAILALEDMRNAAYPKFVEEFTNQSSSLPNADDYMSVDEVIGDLALSDQLHTPQVVTIPYACDDELT